MIKTTLIFLLLWAASVTATFACELCKKNQPKVLENITHGAGPTGTLDYVITWGAIVLVTFTLILSIRFLVRPKESQADHIKNIVLNQH